MMKNSIIILTMLQMLVISNSCISQSGVHGCYGFDCKKKTWYLSFKTGVPILGPANELEKAMIESGFGDSHIHYGGFWGPGGTTEYPQHSNRLNWEFELKHQLNKRSSLAISLGNSWTQSVTGNDEKGFNEIWGQYWGNTLQLKSVARTLTFQYVFSTWKKGNDGLSIGPAFTFHQVLEKGSAINPYRHTAIKPGIHVGYNFSIINSETWFLNGNITYKRFLNDKIGTITVEPTSPLAGDSREASIFKGAKMNMQTLNFGITTGIRF